MLVETNQEGNAEDVKLSTVDHEPHKLLVFQVDKLGHDQDGEDSHNHPLSVADTKEEHKVGLLLGGGVVGLPELRMRFGRLTHDDDDGVQV